MNQTQILSIVTKPFESNRGFYVHITFTINTDSYYYGYFIEETKDKINPLLTFKEGIFTYQDAITSSPTTEGILQYLDDLMEEDGVKGNFSLECNILRSLKALNQFWD